MCGTVILSPMAALQLKKPSGPNRKANAGGKSRFALPKIRLWASVSVRLPGSKRYIVLRPRTHAVDFLDQVSQILAARHEINLRGVHHQQRRLIVVKKELIERLCHLGEVFEGYASL